MPRLLGVEIPGRQTHRSVVALHLRPWPEHRETRARAGQHRSERAREGPFARAAQRRSSRRSPTSKLLIEGDLRRELQSNLKRLAGDQLLSRHPSSPRPSGARPAHLHQRAHPERSAQNRRRAAQSKTPRPAKFKFVTCKANPHGRRNQSRSGTRPRSLNQRQRPRQPNPPSPRRPRACPRPPAAAEGAEERRQGQKGNRSRRRGSAEGKSLARSETRSSRPKIVKAKGSKNVHTGIAHVQASFNNTIVTITDLTGAGHRLVERRQSRLQRLAQEHGLRRADGRAGCLPPGDGTRPQGSRSPRERARAPDANPQCAPSRPSAWKSASSAT